MKIQTFPRAPQGIAGLGAVPSEGLPEKPASLPGGVGKSPPSGPTGHIALTPRALGGTRPVFMSAVVSLTPFLCHALSEMLSMNYPVFTPD